MSVGKPESGALNVGRRGYRVCMLRAVDPHDSPSESAYRVPWRIDRGAAPRYELLNVGHERLVGIHLALLGTGALIWGLPTALSPGQRFSFILHSDDPSRATVVLVRWFRPDGAEYLWRVSF
ncbi:hypothetical protein [Luethyella okanaganae]|uniref:PilZ domain-containing protein n=1 Tax=Luethyella okanaganae TaxID=69372 RepID=A0ABW1VDI0_9MICO